MYIITREENEYDQMGEYFVAAFNYKPTENDLFDLFSQDPNKDSYNYETLVKHLVNGGGRRNKENTWYHLRNVTPGILFYTE